MLYNSFQNDYRFYSIVLLSIPFSHRCFNRLSWVVGWLAYRYRIARTFDDFTEHSHPAGANCIQYEALDNSKVPRT